MKLEHIGIAVKSIDKRLAVWQGVLGFSLLYVKEVPEQKVKVAVLDCHGIHIELLEAMDEQSAVRSFIDKRGEGVHHLCFKVDDIEHALAMMKHEKVKLIDETARTGASGKKIAFIHPKNLGGVLIELTE
ncbi:methylmalonyl-CoA epimerase [candidate division WOR-3 bacterium]|nr:methylmalonyl-CoA epimerase [candidate division WOR-3 bacterium]